MILTVRNTPSASCGDSTVKATGLFDFGYFLGFTLCIQGCSVFLKKIKSDHRKNSLNLQSLGLVICRLGFSFVNV